MQALLAHRVGIALGVRHILEALNERGYVIDTLHVTGGHTQNPLLMELYADATGCTVVEPLADDAVLLGTGDGRGHRRRALPRSQRGLPGHAAGRRARARPNPARAQRFDRDYRVFLEMHRQRQALDAMA